jgi:hypothetical protein
MVTLLKCASYIRTIINEFHFYKHIINLSLAYSSMKTRIDLFIFLMKQLTEITQTRVSAYFQLMKLFVVFLWYWQNKYLLGFFQNLNLSCGIFFRIDHQTNDNDQYQQRIHSMIFVMSMENNTRSFFSLSKKISSFVLRQSTKSICIVYNFLVIFSLILLLLQASCIRTANYRRR